MPYGTINVDKVIDTSGGVLAPISSVFRNRIINGAMVIDQRNAGASVTPANGAYCPDRWRAELTQSSKYSVQQVSDSPDGFVNSLKITSLSSYSITSTDQFNIRQAVEGFNTADLMYGTANAKTITVSFWVKSSLTGTFGASLANSNNTLLYNFNYTINAANTWEYKTSTIVGPTSGTWQTTTSAGIHLRFNLGLGATYGSTTTGSWVSGTDIVGNPSATSVVGTNGATLYITGVQLEKGSTATSFDYRPYGTELALCQRYYQKYSNSSGAASSVITIAQAYSTTAVIGAFVPPVSFRAAPTISGNNYATWTATASDGGGTSISIGAGSNTNLLRIEVSGASGLVAGNASGIQLKAGTSSFIDLSAEL
jgi:hypothetical protein